MDKPNHILNFKETVLVPVEEGNVKKFVRIAIWIIVCILILGSFVFQDNLFLEMGWATRILLIILAVLFSFRKKEYIPSSISLQFYEDYLIIYQPRRWYSNQEIRKQFGKMYYKDITKCKYLMKSKRIQIYGKGVSRWKTYNKDGSIKNKHTIVRDFENGMFYFNTSMAENIDFVYEIESHSPLRIVLEDA